MDFINDLAKEVAEPQLTVFSKDVTNGEELPENVEIDENISINTIKREPDEISIDPLASDPTLDLNINLTSEEWIKDEGNESDVDALDATASETREKSTNIKLQQCQFCDFSTKHKYSLKKHIEIIHFNLKNFKCDLCDYSTTTQLNLKIHKDKNHLKNEYSCTSCEYKTYVERYVKPSVKLHLERQHTKKVKCSHCSYGTYCESVLKTHIKCVHDKINKLECQHCNYKTYLKSSLKNHINIKHLKIKKFKCNLCYSKFCFMSSLNFHKKFLHIKENGLKCKYCKYCTLEEDDLINHFKNNHKEEAIEDKAGKSNCAVKKEEDEADVDDVEMTEDFMEQEVETPRQLRSNSHNDKKISKEKKEKCDLCDYSTTTKKELTKHKEKHIFHDNLIKKTKTNYKCTECDFTTYYKQHLKKHFTNVHEKERKFC